MDSVVGGCLITAYLQDRGILDESHMVALSGVRTLSDSLESGISQTRQLFEGLTEHFNGDVFGAIPSALSSITAGDLLGVSALLRGDDLPTDQRALWPYDFSVLPADLVSSVYEQLLEAGRKSEGTYYTPRFLVDLVLDEVIPWRNDAVPRVIDVACGSGAFMIEAYRRLIYNKRAESQTDEVSYDELEALLLDSIFGIDKDLTAARVAAFGLYLALLDEVQTTEVWTSVTLPKLLDKNIVVSDAFDDHALRHEKFDIVVSNPPWKSKFTAPAAKYVNQHALPVADRQMAQAFLWLSAEMLRPNGHLGLVMPAKSLLYNRSSSAQLFRRSLFTRLRVDAIIDLSALRHSVFSNAVAPAAVVIAGPSLEWDDLGLPRVAELVHVAAHPRTLGAPTDALVITPEEVRSISSVTAASRPEIWKVMLWGSIRDLALIDHLRSKFPPLKRVVRERDWLAHRGFQREGGDRNNATELFGLPIIETSTVRLLALADEELQLFERPYLHRTRSRRLYSSPLVLIRRGVVEGRLAATLINHDAVFPDGVIGISGSEGDIGRLALVAAVTVSSLGRYWHFFTSASWGVERDYVELNEHLTIPVAEPSPDQARELLDILDSARFDVNDDLLARLDRVVFAAYGLGAEDQRRVRDRMETAIKRFYSKRSGLLLEVSESSLNEYAQVLQDTLTTTFPELSTSTRHFSLGPYRTVTARITESSSSLSNEGEIYEPVQVDVDLILRSAQRTDGQPTGIVAQPAGFFVDENVFYLVKTADSDRWSYDAALEDADRIVAAIVHSDHAAVV